MTVDLGVWTYVDLDYNIAIAMLIQDIAKQNETAGVQKMLKTVEIRSLDYIL